MTCPRCKQEMTLLWDESMGEVHQCSCGTTVQVPFDKRPDTLDGIQKTDAP